MSGCSLRGRVGRGFALQELCAVLAVAGVLACVLLIMGGHSRRHARIGEDLSRMRSIAAGTGAYAADHEDRIFGFSYRGGVVNPSPFPDLAAPTSSDREAASRQMTEIVRLHGGRMANETPSPTNLFPYYRYSWVVLAKYMDLPIPHRMFTSTGSYRGRWADDPRGYDQGLYTPHFGIGGDNWRWPYSGDLWIGTAFFDESEIPYRAYPSGSFSSAPYTYTYQLTKMRQRPLSAVAFPSQKVLANSEVAWHFKPEHHMAPDARTPALMVDGSAAVRAFADANRGANPNEPAGPAPILLYQPPVYGPDPLPGGGAAAYYAGPLWTRMGLQGRDFGGPEVFP